MGILRMNQLHRKRTALLLTSAVAMTPLTAYAADIYQKPAPANYTAPAPYVEPNMWGGFYVGINGGYGWSGSGSSIGYNDGGDPGFIGADQSGRAQPSGGFGGA